MISRVPGLGLATRAEWKRVAGKTAPPAIPDYLFREKAAFGPGPHRIILCREDVREGLLQARRANEPMGELLHRPANVPRAMLAAQLKRLLDAMRKCEDFEVALMPRSAFKKLELEMVCWPGSVAAGWLQDGSESMFAVDGITVRTYAAAMEYTWDKMQKGWKRRRNVTATLHKWLAGDGLDTPEQDSKIVENWDLMPRE